MAQADRRTSAALCADRKTPEEWAEALVNAVCKEPGGPWFIRLGETPEGYVFLGPSVGRDVARAEAEMVRKFVTGVIRQAIAPTPDSGLQAPAPR